MLPNVPNGTNEDVPVDTRELIFALDRLAMGFESADPHIRHEAKMVAKQNFGQLAYELEHPDENPLGPPPSDE